MSIFVQLVIGELQFVKGHDLLHPIGADGWRVGMHMNPGRGNGIRLASHHPAGAVANWSASFSSNSMWPWLFNINLLVKGVAIAFVIHGHKVHHANVGGMWIQTTDPHLKRGKHASARLGDDHFGALGMELIPQRLRLQHHNGLGQRWMHWLRFLNYQLEIIYFKWSIIYFVSHRWIYLHLCWYYGYWASLYRSPHCCCLFCAVPWTFWTWWMHWLRQLMSLWLPCRRLLVPSRLHCVRRHNRLAAIRTTMTTTTTDPGNWDSRCCWCCCCCSRCQCCLYCASRCPPIWHRSAPAACTSCDPCQPFGCRLQWSTSWCYSAG